MSISFIVLLGNKDIYEKCFLSSPLFQSNHGRERFQIISQSGFETAGQAFNEALEKVDNDVVVCIHQDVVLPVTWATRFLEKLNEVESMEVPLGVVGCWGITSEGERAGHVYHRDRQLFPRRPGDSGNRGAISLPHKVQTLDELMISFRKSSGLRFDPALPSFFGYAVDLCLTAEAKGLRNFVIDCPCIHQTADQLRIRKELSNSATYLIEKWQKSLPIPTPSGPLESKWSLRRDKLKLDLMNFIGYSPSRMWWEDLPQIDPQRVLFAETPATDNTGS